MLPPFFLSAAQSDTEQRASFRPWHRNILKAPLHGPEYYQILHWLQFRTLIKFRSREHAAPLN